MLTKVKQTGHKVVLFILIHTSLFGFTHPSSTKYDILLEKERKLSLQRPTTVNKQNRKKQTRLSKKKKKKKKQPQKQTKRPQFMMFFCYPVYKSLEVSNNYILFHTVVRALDLKSRGRV